MIIFFGLILCPPGPLWLQHYPPDSRQRSHSCSSSSLGSVPQGRSYLAYWNQEGGLDDLWITFRVLFPSYLRIEHIHLQIGLLFFPIKSSNNLPSFCPISNPFSSNWLFIKLNLVSSLSSASPAISLLFSSQHAFSFFWPNMGQLRIFQIFKFQFLFA